MTLLWYGYVHNGLTLCSQTPVAPFKKWKKFLFHATPFKPSNMSDNNHELILGFCPLPDVNENAADSNGGDTSNPSAEYEGEVITADMTEYKVDPTIIKIEEASSFSDSANVSLVVSEDTSDTMHETNSISEFLDFSKSHTSVSSFVNDTYERPAKRRRQTLPKGKFQCAECRSLCEDFNIYAAHMNTHSAVPLFTCPKCLYMFQDESLFSAHTAQVCKAAGHSKDKECAVCGKFFKYDSHLREHIICMHNKTPMFSCPICGQNITSWRRSIDRHMSNQADRKSVV